MERYFGSKSILYLIKKLQVSSFLSAFVFFFMIVLFLNFPLAHGYEFIYNLAYNQVETILHQVSEGEIAYIAYSDTGGEYHIAAIQTGGPGEPLIIWSLNIPDYIKDLYLDEAFLYSTTNTNDVWIIDVAVLDAPRLLAPDFPQQEQTKERYRTAAVTQPFTFPLYNQYSFGNLFGSGSLYAGFYSSFLGFGTTSPWGYQSGMSYYPWQQTQPWSMSGTFGTFSPYTTLSPYSNTWSTYGQYPFGVTSYLTPGFGYGLYGMYPGFGSIWPQLTGGTSTSQKPTTTVVKYRSPVSIRLSLDNPSTGEVTGQITMRLKDLNGKAISEQEETLTLGSGENVYPLTLTKVPEKTYAEDFAKYNLSYGFSGEGVTLSGEKSLFYAADKLEVRLVGPDSMFAGKPTTIGVHAFVHGHPVPIEGASVTVDLIVENTTKRLYSNTTDESGFTEASLNIPENFIGAGRLRTNVTSDLGSETITEDIEIVRLYKILLTTDKPLYQPGQTIHIRTLTLKKPDLLPEAGKKIIIEVEDSKGNKVFRVEPATDEFGIAAADFTLGTDINLGLYAIRAISMENEESEKKVKVDRYVLPKFEVSLVTDEEYYQPGDTVQGTVNARYFFGKSLGNATVTVEASKFDVEFVLFQTISGQTDVEGFFDFDLTLPSYFVGLPLEQGNAFVKLDIKVEDSAEHVETTTRELTITRDPIIVRVVPESGVLVTGVENRVYLITTDPKGRGLATTNQVDFGGSVFNVNTDDQGLGSFNVIPEEDASHIVRVTSQKNGQSAVVELDLSDPSGQPKILLRTDKAIYSVGDTMTIDVYTTTESIMARRVFLDIIRDRQTLLTKGVDVNNGHGQLVLDMSSDMEGTILVEAYYISLATESASDVFRDKKIVYVNPASDIQVTATMDKDQYLPGEKAMIEFQVIPPQPTALGISIVDEAVYALQENRPGLLKVYFSMEEDIAKPRFWPLLFPFEEAITSETPSEEVQEMTEVAFATAEEPDDPGLDVSSFPDLLQRMKEALASRIDKDADKVAKDLGNEWIYNEWAYEQALSEGRIKKYKDPWDKYYRLTVGDNQVILTSNGPDKRPDTPDDISYAKRYEPVYRPNPPAPRQVQPIVPWWGGAPFNMFFGMPFAAPAPALDVGRTAQAYQGVGGFAGYGAAYGTAADTGGTYAPETKAGFLYTGPQEGEEPADGEIVTEEPRKIRRDFPETLLWEPSLITDPNGTAYLDANMADSITTWRLSTLASTGDGKMGGNTEEIVVFQDFFIDLDLPVALTQNDEISLPVALYNYLDESQTVRITLEVDQNNLWFELMELTNEKQVNLEAGQVTVVYFRIRALEVGWHELTVFGYGTEMSDAIARRIEVLPDGLEFRTNISDRLRGSATSQVIHIPPNAIDNASKILVKVYPGIFSQVVEGLDTLFRVPHGCFTQSTTITWPNVLVLHYMITTDQITPAIEMKAREYINLGYQRLLTFECPNGGFSWYGNEPGKPVLTAYGLMEFTDMAQVHYVDPAMIQRTQAWLVGKQAADGSWPPDTVREAFNILSNKLQATAYAVWALIRSGYSPNHEKIVRGLDYVRAHWEETNDNYTLALCAHALLQADSQNSTALIILDLLESEKIVDGDTVYWNSIEPSMTYSRGNNLTIETTAMITLAFMKAGWRHSQSIDGAINYIIQQKDAFGRWGQTQATVLSLRVLMEAMSGQIQEMDAEITISINGNTIDKDDLPILKINPVDSSVLRLIDLQPYTVEGDNDVGIALIGEGNLLYQFVGSYFLPWAGVIMPTEPQLDIELTYDRTDLTVDDIIQCTVTVTNTIPDSVVPMGMIDLGLPPGFRIFWEDFENAIEENKIFKYESTNRQLTLYMHPIVSGESISITYRLQAKYPLRVSTPKSSAYDYYNRDKKDETKPVILTVTD